MAALTWRWLWLMSGYHFPELGLRCTVWALFVTRPSGTVIASTVPDQFSATIFHSIAPMCLSDMLMKRRVSRVVSRPARSRKLRLGQSTAFLMSSSCR